MVSQVEILSDREKELLANYDSRLYGFLRQHDPIGDPSLPNLNHRSLLLKGVVYFEKELQEKGKSAHPAIFSKLGHLHLLTEDLPKALSAYQKFYNLPNVDYWKDAPFLYGIGLVYFNFSAYQWATKVFQQVLYLDPGFSCSNEVHLRLAIIYKAQNNYEASIKHFHMALMDSNPCSLSKEEIHFHLGHLFEMQNKCQEAQEMYETLINSPGVSNGIKANAYKQLGWMYYNKEHLGDRASRMQKAVQLLQKAIETDPSNGSTWYLIGRCYAMQGKVHDAFTSYRHAIDKSEANADTWCSIGVLYQQQNQPMDALQAYVCAIQLDPMHVAAWTDLGILYEACDQPGDAIMCYSAAKKYGATDLAIDARIKALQAKQAMAAKSAPNVKKNIPSVGEAWKLPIPAELTTRTMRNVQSGQSSLTTSQSLQLLYTQQQLQQQQLQHQQLQPDRNTLLMNNHVQPQEPKPPEINKGLQPVVDQKQPPIFQGQTSLPPSSNGNNFTMHNGNTELDVNTSNGINGHHPQQQQNFVNNSNGRLGLESQGIGQQNGPVTGAETVALTSLSSDPLLSSASSRASDISSSLGQSNSMLLTAQSVSNSSRHSSEVLPSPMEGLTSNTSVTSSEGTSSLPDALTRSDNPTLGSGGGSTNEYSSSSFSSPTYVSSPTQKFSTSVSFSPNLTQPLTVNACSLSPSSKQSLLSPSLISPPMIAMASPSLSKSPLTSGIGPSAFQVPKVSLLYDATAIPSPPKQPHPPLPTDKLSPPTPSISVENKRDAYSQALQNFALSPSQPVTVIRGLANALKLDLNLYSTKTLVECNGDHQLEVRMQRQQASDENWDPQGEKKVWLCESSRSYTTIAKYAQYQANTFQESLKEEEERITKSKEPIQSDSDSSSSSRSKKNSRGFKFKWIKFGTNVDLSDERKWKDQLQELNKLPQFIRVVAPNNLLSHFGHTILGMNSVQLYMKIPGSRTPGHQENNCLCAVNMNIGPGDCEWFATPSEYWGVIHNLCEKHGINFLTGSWWPVLEELYEERVPVYRFIQRPGDLVWLNPGVVHWVQALGWCNNIAWNVGPISAHVFNAAVERYEWNKLQGEKSIVAMIHMTWNLARNIRVSDKRLYEHIRVILERTLKYCQITLDNLKRSNIEVQWHGRRPDEAPHYCIQCEVEVFNLLFVFVTNNRKHQVYCQDCARKTSSTLEGFSVLNQYTMEELMETYKSFKLYTVPSVSQEPIQSHPPAMSQPSSSYVHQTI
ncbi:lysine-specific demethylase 6A-like isoform X2 [Actinia tenebrosa]|uniref:[histone H3]-trimethyl-L-lysine(27) demethylase n=1 Tax=Actinia tenebrosa TaxID=6105 RepID=A0A6P8HQ97_ACTTE|nr:lysine-specific demethylase 6A-like isoform X2 [Actinia tenebrosa]